MEGMSSSNDVLIKLSEIQAELNKLREYVADSTLSDDDREAIGEGLGEGHD